MTNKIREPKIKVGENRKCYAGFEYKVLKISNEYSEVSEYDSTGICSEFSTDESLYEIGLDPEDVLYCAVENIYTGNDEEIKEYVFLISRDSEILGE